MKDFKKFSWELVPVVFGAMIGSNFFFWFFFRPDDWWKIASAQTGIQFFGILVVWLRVWFSMRRDART